MLFLSLPGTVKGISRRFYLRKENATQEQKALNKDKKSRQSNLDDNHYMIM